MSSNGFKEINNMDKDNPPIYNKPCGKNSKDKCSCLKLLLWIMLVILVVNLIPIKEILRSTPAAGLFIGVCVCAFIITKAYKTYIIAGIKKRGKIELSDIEKIKQSETINIYERLIKPIISRQSDKKFVAQTIKSAHDEYIDLPENCLRYWTFYTEVPNKYKNTVYGYFIYGLKRAQKNFNKYDSFREQNKTLIWYPLRIYGFGLLAMLSLGIIAFMLWAYANVPLMFAGCFFLGSAAFAAAWLNACIRFLAMNLAIKNKGCF